MRVLVACEYSGRVRDAFCRLGHDAVSCDLLPSEGDTRYPHIQGDCLEVAKSGYWDMMIAFPPCTHLSASGARWWPEKIADGRQQAAISFVESLWALNIPRLCIENPIGCLPSKSKLGKPKQVIQPWQFGHGETKATCLWLRGLSKLRPTKIVPGREPRIWKLSGKNRAKRRSLTYSGIADAMARQWGGNARNWGK